MANLSTMLSSLLILKIWLQISLIHLGLVMRMKTMIMAMTGVNGMKKMMRRMFNDRTC